MLTCQVREATHTNTRMCCVCGWSNRYQLPFTLICELCESQAGDPGCMALIVPAVHSEVTGRQDSLCNHWRLTTHKSEFIPPCESQSMKLHGLTRLQEDGTSNMTLGAESGMCVLCKHCEYVQYTTGVYTYLVALLQKWYRNGTTPTSNIQEPLRTVLVAMATVVDH